MFCVDGLCNELPRSKLRGIRPSFLIKQRENGRAPFSFMALFGAMRLMGMMIKNAIVLLDEVNINLTQGMGSTTPLSLRHWRVYALCSARSNNNRARGHAAVARCLLGRYGGDDLWHGVDHAGGGLTVIANAPNPAGQAILKDHFENGVAPLGLLLGALIPTLIMFAMFFVLR